MTWTIATHMPDGTRVQSPFRFWTRKGAARWAQLATVGSAARLIWQPVKTRRRK